MDELFGKLSADATGGGRASYQIVNIGRRRVAEHVRAARAAGIRFNYLLNGACLDNREFTRQGQKEIRSLLDWLSEIGVEAVTLSSPFLLRIVKVMLSPPADANLGIRMRGPRAQGAHVAGPGRRFAGAGQPAGEPANSGRRRPSGRTSVWNWN